MSASVRSSRPSAARAASAGRAEASTGLPWTRSKSSFAMSPGSGSPRHVDRHELRRRTDQLGGVGAVRLVDIGDHDRAPLHAEPSGERGPDPHRRSGDDRDLPRQLHPYMPDRATDTIGPSAGRAGRRAGDGSPRAPTGERLGWGPAAATLGVLDTPPVAPRSQAGPPTSHSRYAPVSGTLLMRMKNRHLLACIRHVETVGATTRGRRGDKRRRAATGPRCPASGRCDGHVRGLVAMVCRRSDLPVPVVEDCNEFDDRYRTALAVRVLGPTRRTSR